MTKIVTVQRHLIETERQFPEATGDLTGLLWDLTLAFKMISREVNKAGLAQILGKAGETNASGDEVMKLDRFAQDIIYRAMDHGGHLCCMASEEESKIIPIPKKYPKGKYTLAFDPLDGSSNIDANVSVGTIFGIHRRLSESEGPDGSDGTVDDVLQPARDLVAAGYVIYGSSTMLVYSTGRGVHGFTLDPSLGEFLLSHAEIRIPNKGAIYSVNEGYRSYWHDNVRRYVDHVKTPEGGPMKGRYIGSMVSDVHRTLLYGGIFLYPLTYRRADKGSAKLRLLYEAGPMGYLVAQAGGIATTGDENLLNIVPEGLHQRVPVVLGSPDNVKTYLDFHNGER